MFDDKKGSSSAKTPGNKGAQQGKDSATRNMMAEWNYQRFLEELQRGNLSLDDNDTIQFVLENIDDACVALSSIKSLESAQLLLFETERALEITDEENQVAWKKLLSMLANIKSVEYMDVRFFLRNDETVADLVQALSEAKVSCLDLTFPLPASVPVDSLKTMVKAVSCIQYNHTALCFDERNVGRTETNRFKEDGVVSKLIACVDKVSKVKIENATLTMEECISFANMMSSSMFEAKRLMISNCKFLEAGGQTIANALRANDSLTALILCGIFEEESFCTALISELPRNSSLDTLTLLYESLDDNLCVLKSFVFNLLKKIARDNDTVLNFAVTDIDDKKSSLLNDMEKQELHDALTHNYALETIEIDGEEPFQTITRLNRAGRGYIRGDAPTGSDCVQVLSHNLVHDNLDCLFHHVRHEAIPYLFAGVSGHSVEDASDHRVDETSSRKRSAEDNGSVASSSKRHAK